MNPESKAKLHRLAAETDQLVERLLNRETERPSASLLEHLEANILELANGLDQAPDVPEALLALLAAAESSGDYGAFMEYFPRLEKLAALPEALNEEHAARYARARTRHAQLLDCCKRMQDWEKNHREEDLHGLFRLACSAGTYHDCEYDEGGGHGSS